jgi:lipoprotein-anchoring transpeptidase ErfK/SrfK
MIARRYATLIVAGVVILTAAWLHAEGAKAPTVAAAGASLTGPAPVLPGYSIGRAAPLTTTTATWAPLTRRVRVHVGARRRSRVVATLPVRTPDRTTTIVEVTGRSTTTQGLWIRVRYPSRKPNSVGWLPRQALGGYTSVNSRLVIDRASLTITLERAGRVAFRAPIGIGAPGTPTPPGRFYITDRLTRFADPFYGPIAFGTSARSRVLTDWPGGGEVGIHGTNAPQLIPGRVSHGCIRLRNHQIRQLARILPIGTPVVIR